MRTVTCSYLLVCSLVLAGCDSQTNLIGRTIPSAHHDNFHYNMDMARAFYDAGEASKARKYAQKAFYMDPDSEDASLLLGFIDLSLAGGDPFNLAKALIESDRKKKEAQEAGKAEGATATTSDTLSSIKEVIGVSDAELQLLGSKDTSDPELPLIIPNCAEDARSQVQRLQYLNEAIRAVCPFVDPSVRNEGDYRQLCDETSKHRRFAGKAHFLWAFAHLTEALGFNSVLTYSTSSDPVDTQSNLEKRVVKVQAMSTADGTAISQLISSLEAVEQTVGAVFPVNGICSESAPTSQLRATLNDMLAVDAAFSNLAGVPDNIVSSIRISMAKIANLGGANGVGSQLTAMKGDFTKKMGTSLSNKIDQLASDSEQPLNSDQKEQLCTLLSSISPSTARPTTCQ